jgi:hypothetical protein
MRTRYLNGDPIQLSCGCNDCNVLCINRVICHEQGCPSTWKDSPRECIECGKKFFSPQREQKTCHRH